MTTKEFFESYKNGNQYFSDLDFDEATGFSGISLTGITFESCYLLDVDFSNSDLSNARFITCNLKCTDFRGSNLTNASIINCSVESAMFENATTKNMTFSENGYYGATLQQDDLESFLKSGR
jgi:fluoroquinolone resistance protein